MGVKSPWRAYLDLDFRVTENRRSDKVLDTLKQKYRRMGAPHRGQHKTQRGVGVFVVVDIENFLSSAKTFHQGRKLTPGAPSTIVRARELLVASHIFRLPPGTLQNRYSPRWFRSHPGNVGQCL